MQFSVVWDFLSEHIQGSRPRRFDQGELLLSFFRQMIFPPCDGCYGIRWIARPLSDMFKRLFLASLRRGVESLAWFVCVLVLFRVWSRRTSLTVDWTIDLTDDLTRLFENARMITGL